MNVVALNVIYLQGVCMSLLSQSFHAHYKNNNASGSVYLMSLNQTFPAVTKLEIISQSEEFKVETFRPHGISVWPDNLSGDFKQFKLIFLK